MASKKLPMQGLQPADGGGTNQPPAPPPLPTEQTTTSTTGQFWDPPARWAIVDGKREYGKHNGLVNAAGRIVPYYDLNQAPDQLAATLGGERFNSLLLDLKTMGFSVGNPAQQSNVIAELMRQANANGYTWDVMLQRWKNSSITNVGAGGSYGYRVSNADDLKAMARQVSRNTLGREFTDDEAQRFVSAYQSMERTQGPNVASADVFAQKFAQQNAPKEAAGYKFLGYMNQIFNAFGGRSNA